MDVAVDVGMNVDMHEVLDVDMDVDMHDDMDVGTDVDMGMHHGCLLSVPVAASCGWKLTDTEAHA